MTTICFDGQELVADSRVTFVDTDENDVAILDQVIGKDDTLVKIVEPKTFTLQGEPVLAIGVAGDCRIPEAFLQLDARTEYQGQPIVKEIHNEAFFGQWKDLHCEVQFIVVSRSFWAIGAMQANEDRSLVNFNLQLYSRGPTQQWAMIGSGPAAIQKQLTLGLFPEEVTLADIQAKSARKCVQLGIICDPMSGGPLTVWSDATGVEIVELEIEPQVMKDLLEENHYAAGTLDDSEALDARVRVLKARRQVEQTA